MWMQMALSGNKSPEQYGFEGELVEWYKTAQTTNGAFCMLIKCIPGEFDYLDFDGDLISLDDGRSVSFYRSNTDYHYDNNLSNYLV